jgi:transposase
MNHLGIVSGLCKELHLAENIDRLIIPDPQQRVTTGQAVVSMILNGLGFSNRTLYLFPQFLENKPVNLLIGNELEAIDFSDDTLGRTLDRLYHYGCTEFFCQIASEAATIADIDKKFGHLDTTTLSVHGEYESSEEDDAAIHITHGHAKQNRFDLKQIFLNLLVASDGGVPLFMQALDGNSADPTTFRRTITEFRKGLKYNLQEITYWIADSAFYNEQTIKEVGSEVCWISHVPETIKEVQNLLNETSLHLYKMKENQAISNAGDMETNHFPLPFKMKEEGYSYNTH